MWACSQDVPLDFSTPLTCWTIWSSPFGSSWADPAAVTTALARRRVFSPAAGCPRPPPSASGRVSGMSSAIADEFEAHRPRLFGLAYRMLGSADEAEDAVQDAYLRFSGADRTGIEYPAAWLAKVVTNLCLTRLTSARARREQYVGPWLPEPVVTSDGTPARWSRPSSAMPCRWPCWSCWSGSALPSARCTCCGRRSGTGTGDRRRTGSDGGQLPSAVPAGGAACR